MSFTWYDESRLDQLIAALTAETPKPNPFPSFEDGDVEIRLTTSAHHIYRVHSLVLGLHSPFFKASLSKRWAGDHDGASSSDPILWRYEVRFPDGQADGICVRKGAAEQSHISSLEDSDESKPSRLLGYYDEPTTTLAKARRNCIDAHSHILGLIYHKPLDLPKASFIEVKGPLEAIMTLADMYGCSSLVATHLENYLSSYKHNVDVLTECYKNMPGMLDFSTKLRSAWLFRETMLYAVNDSRRPEQICENVDIIVLIEKKRSELLSKISSVDQQILFHVGYPKGEETLVHILARAYFRDWFTHKLKKQGLSLRPGYAKVYRRIHRRKVPSVKKFQNFLERAGRPESVSVPAFCSAVLDCFSQAVTYVHRLVSCSTMRYIILGKNNGALHAPLTCIDIHEDELPWKGKVW